MYDPTIGEFLSDDPLGFAGGDTNLRRYVMNSPSNFTDPEGMEKRVSGAYEVVGVGHHYVPVELWEFFGFSDEAKKVFDGVDKMDGVQALLPTPLGHNNRAHGAVTGYTGHVKVELNAKLNEFIAKHGDNGKLTVELQKQFAKEFIEHIKTGTKNEFIKGFLKAVPKGIAAVDAWHLKIGKTLAEPVFVKSMAKIAGIAKVSLAGPLKKTIAFGKRVPGGKYALSAFVFVMVYNNARADGLSVKDATALASIEVVNPLPIGPDDMRQVGKWHDGVMATEERIKNGQANPDDFEHPTNKAIIRNRNTQRALEDELFNNPK